MRAFCLCLLLLPCLLRAESGDGYPPLQVAFANGVTGLPELIYRREPGFRPLKLDLYLPPAAVQGSRPLILFVHGGGWALGTPLESALRDWPQQLAALAAHGYVVAAPAYRLSGEAAFPAALEDLRASLRWLQANAGRWRIDTRRLLVWGESAGGHLAALLTFQCRAGEPCPRAAVLWYPITDLLGHRFGEMDERFLACPGECTALRRAASPVHAVPANPPPFLLIHGSADRLVPMAQSQRLEQALRARGGTPRLRVLEGIGHGFEAPRAEQARQAAVQALEESLAFIAEQLPTGR